MAARDKDAEIAAALNAAFRDFICEASEAELVDSLREEGEDLDDLAARAKKAALRALGVYRSRTSDDEIALQRSLGVLLQMLRRREGLSEAELAAHARIEIEEIRKIEADPSHAPKPRTIYQLEQFFGLPGRSLVLLSGVAMRSDNELRGEVLRFAAHSTEFDKLSRHERKLLNDFVRFLGSRVSS